MKFYHEKRDSENEKALNLEVKICEIKRIFLNATTQTQELFLVRAKRF